MLISFAWTTPALLSGHKTVTRREWTYGHARKFTVGMLVDAWDRSPRTGKGRKVATIRITRPPRRESTANLPTEDYAREGFAWLRDHGHREMVDRVMESWGMYPREVWVVEFQLVDVVGATMPRQGAVRSGENEPAADDQHFSSRRGGHGS